MPVALAAVTGSANEVIPALTKYGDRESTWVLSSR
jgi:hypothetical protein